MPTSRCSSSTAARSLSTPTRTGPKSSWSRPFCGGETSPPDHQRALPRGRCLTPTDSSFFHSTFFARIERHLRERTDSMRQHPYSAAVVGGGAGGLAGGIGLAENGHSVKVFELCPGPCQKQSGVSEGGQARRHRGAYYA